VFLYDFDGNIIGESDETGDFSKEYLYRGSSRLAMVDVSTEEVYYYGNDALGTPEILTASDNTVVWEAIYKPFGEAEVNTLSSVTNSFRFPGQYFDEETGFHYNYLRYYETSTGRYLSPDPIGQFGGINLYIYAQNDPVNAIDPFGLMGSLKNLMGTKPPSNVGQIPISSIGQHALDGAQAYYEAHTSMAESDYNFYMNNPFGDHRYNGFKDVNWEEYGDDFSEAYKNYTGEILSGDDDEEDACE